MAADKVKGVLSELETMCECSICCHTYDDECHVPRVLPCQHTFCTECLTKHCRKRRLKCPLCNQDHNIKNENVDKLPKDYTRCNLKDLLETLSKSLCKECQNQNHVKFICKTCDVRMCHICCDNKKRGTCNLHTIEIVKDLSDTTEIDSKSICMSPGHENNELKYFCCEKSCCNAVCAHCVVEFHKNHTIKPVKDEYETRKKIMQSHCQAAKSKIITAKSTLEKLVEKIAFITQTGANGKTSLGEQAKKGINYITDFENKSKKKADEKLLQYLNMLKKRKEQVESFIGNASECCSISEESLTGRNIVAFLSVEKTLTDKLTCFEKSDIDKPLDTVPQAEEFDLQAETSELKEKIDRMTNNTPGINKSNVFKEFLNNNFGSGTTTNDREKRSIMDLFISISMTILLYAIIILWYSPVPYSHVFEVDYTYLALRKSQWSSNTCYSADGRIVSNIPIENTRQTCGNLISPYIYRGVFTNSTFWYRQGDSFSIQLDVSAIKRYSPGLILFEFGISNGAIERQNLEGPLSSAFYGWSLKVLNAKREAALINSEGKIVQSKTISAFDQESYTFYIKLNSNRTIVLKTENKNGTSLDETGAIKGNTKRGFVKICSANEAYVTVKSISDNVTFDKSTLYPNLYIATNRKTISNKKLPLSSKKKVDNNFFQDIMLLNCETKCVYVLNLRVDSPTTAEVFSVVLTNSQFLPSAHYNVTLFTYTLCTAYRFTTYESYCLMVHRNNAEFSVVLMEPNDWHSITIMVDRKKKSASFLFGRHEMRVENGYILESDTPILRWVMLSTEDSVKVHLADRDEFDILTWFFYNIFPPVKHVMSLIPIRQQYSSILLLVFCIAYLIWYCRKTDPQMKPAAFANNSIGRRPFARRRQ